MTDRELKHVLTLRMNEGAAKIELYDEFKDAFDNDTLRKILAARPTATQMRIYKIPHRILCVIWGIVLFFELFNIIDIIAYFSLKQLISSCLTIYIAYHIYQFNGRMLLPGMLWLLLNIFFSFDQLFSEIGLDPNAKLLFYLTVIFSAILSIGIYLMYYLKTKVFGYIPWIQPMVQNNHLRDFE